MKRPFTYIILRITYDEKLRAKFAANPKKFIETHKPRLTPTQREALLSRNNKLIYAAIEKEWLESGRPKGTRGAAYPMIPWPVRQIPWPVRK